MRDPSPALAPDRAHGIRILGQARLISRLVWREIPPSLRQFGILIACIALGVAAIVAVISLSRALTDGLSREGRVILGADAAFTLIQREASPAERAALARFGNVSTATFTRAMARAPSGESALVEMKAVDSAYPVAGTLLLDGAAGPETRPLAALLGPDAQGRFGLVADPLLTGRLGLQIGDVVAIGDAQFRIAAHLRREPDRLSGNFGFGPRVIASQAGLAATGLVQPGALTRFTYRLNLSGDQSTGALETALSEIAHAAPDAGWQIATRLRASPNLERQIARFTQFLALVGLTALLVGGVGVANATRAFADRQNQRIAALKSLGASRNFVFASALAQILAFALIGVAIGLVLGALLPRAALAFAGDLLPFPLEAGIDPGALALGLGYGIASVITFALWPLLRARAVLASALFREGGSAPTWRPGWRDVALVTLSAGLFAWLVISTASDQRIAMAYIAAAIGAMLTLRLVAFLVMRLARALPHPNRPVLRLALANLHRPGSLTPSVVLSLGLGLTLLVALTLIDVNLTRQFRSALPGVAPTFFFIDIPSRQIDEFSAFLETNSPGGTLERMPQLRGRIVALNDVPVAKFSAAEQFSWVLEGDRGITYSSTPPEGATIAAGEWWPADYRGPPLVSFAKDVADGLGLKVGDTIEVNVLGRRLTARIANLRQVHWQRLGINFVMVFSPNAFAGAPHTFLATLALPKGAGDAQEIALARAVARSFPTISAVRVKEALAAIDSVISQLAFAVRAASAIALLASVLVLGGALAASTRSRQRESVILKTLGATRRTLLAAMVLEYTALGGIAVVFGLICGAMGARFVVAGLMNLEFALPWLPALSIAFSAFVTTIILGLAGTWHLLGQKPAPYLRHA